MLVCDFILLFENNIKTEVYNTVSKLVMLSYIVYTYLYVQILEDTMHNSLNPKLKKALEL